MIDRLAEAERPLIEAALEEAVGRLAVPLCEAALYAVRAGGKRVRPLLTIAAYESLQEGDPDAEAWPLAGDAAAGGPAAGGAAPSAIHRVAAAVELIHTYSLLHDDLPAMDDDDLRRGRPTTHLVYGVPVATATGAALQHLAFLCLAEAAAGDLRIAEALPDLVRRLAAGAGVEGMVGGQLLDLEAEGRELEPDHLEAIHRMKTAALLSAACSMGAVAAGTPAEHVRRMADYGRALGLAFQIVDDLLDVTGDPATTGKPAGADRARGKATYPATHGERGARDLAAEAGREAREALAALPREAPVLEAFVDYVLERLH